MTEEDRVVWKTEGKPDEERDAEVSGKGSRNISGKHQVDSVRGGAIGHSSQGRSLFSTFRTCCPNMRAESSQRRPRLRGCADHPADAIVERFRVSGGHVRHTHLLGSDLMPLSLMFGSKVQVQTYKNAPECWESAQRTLYNKCIHSDRIGVERKIHMWRWEEKERNERIVGTQSKCSARFIIRVSSSRTTTTMLTTYVRREIRKRENRILL